MARDKFHYSLKRAIEKEGWVVTHDPYNLRIESRRIYPIDIGAEKLIAAAKGQSRIAIEVKSFLQDSLASAFHEASGQYLGYFLGLQIQEPDRLLFLAIPFKEYEALEQMALVQLVVEHLKMNIVVFDPELEIIIKWLNNGREN